MEKFLTDVIYVTAKGLAKIESELNYLRKARLPELAERLHETMGGGDLADNIEYMAVEDEYAFVRGRVLQLEHILRHAELIQPCESDGTVKLGSMVTVQEDREPVETYYLVGTAEADPGEGFISHLSPLGQALLNHRAGDNVVVLTPSGRREFHLIAVG